MEKWVLADRRNDASLFPTVYFESGCGANSPMHRSLGVSLGGMLNVFEGPVWSYYEHPGDWKRAGVALSQKVRADPKFVAHAIGNTYALGEKLLSLTGEIASADLKGKSDAELWAYLDEYGRRLKEMRGWAWIAPALDASGAFTEMLEEVLRRKLKPLGKENQLSTYFATLSNPKKRTLGRQQDLALLKIASEVKKREAWRLLFEGNDPGKIVAGLEAHPALKEKLGDHARKYGWLPCTYEGDAWDLRYFASVLAALIKEGADPDADVRKIEEKEGKARQARQRSIQELNLNSQEARLFDTASDLIFFKADRKDIFFRSYYQMRPLIAEIARRLQLSVRQARMLLPQEFKAALLERKLDRGELQARTHFCIAVLENDSTRVLSGPAAREFMADQVQETVVEQVDELKGSCASPGYAKGAARLILSPRDLPKMKAGDILVANATNPDIVPAMKKAAAIVTNTGGITCHAAIVSRELGIPCVVGTKTATDVFRDGELVEVDATAGVVRRAK